ncbi:MAG: tyrosine-protein phosphatase [Bacilli bacterium]|nr:tyrosine-protein phosphatase [Bacilli bacterium]
MRSIKKTCLAFLIPLAFSLSSCANDTFKTTVRSVSNPAFGNIDFNVTCNDFISAGFEYDDLIDVTIKDVDGHGKDAVFNTAFVKNFNETGYFAPCLCNYEGANEYFELSFSINKTKELGEKLVGKQTVFKMNKKAGFKEKRELVSVPKRLSYEEVGEDNSIYANVRDVTTIGKIGEKIAEGVLYRGSSPFNGKDNPDDREVSADYLLQKIVDEVGSYDEVSEVSLCCVDDKLANLMKEHDLKMRRICHESCTYRLYTASSEITDLKKKTFYPAELAADFFTYKEGSHRNAEAVGEIFHYLAKRAYEGDQYGKKYPAYIHCNEGKDRTGFIVMLLEILADVGVDDIVTDFMQTFVNYYNIDIETQKDKYDALANVGIYRYLYSLMCENPIDELGKIDWYNFDSKQAVEEKLAADKDALKKGTDAYLKNIAHVVQEDINNIKNWLSPTSR